MIRYCYYLLSSILRERVDEECRKCSFLIEPFCGQIKSIDPSIFLDNV